MKRILFICHGNICRSPMAEMIFKHLLKERGLKEKYQVDSAATSTEEIGNPIYPPARAELERNGVNVEPHRARQVTYKDYGVNDLLVCMDKYNVRNLHHFHRRRPTHRYSAAHGERSHQHGRQGRIHRRD